MNIKALGIVALFPLSLFAVTQYFDTTAKSMFRKANVGVTTEAAVAEQFTLSRSDFSLLKIGPDKDAKDEVRNVNSLVYAVGDQGQSSLATAINNIRKDLEAKEGAKAKRVPNGIVAAVAEPVEDKHCRSIRIAAVSTAGAFVNGSYRTVGDTWLVSSYPVKLTSVDLTKPSAVINCAGTPRSVAP